MLVTVEPQMLRAWTCCKPPGDRLLTDYVVHELPFSNIANGISQRATQVLRWINLVSGQFFKENSTLFRRDQRADQMLLENLRFSSEGAMLGYLLTGTTENVFRNLEAKIPCILAAHPEFPNRPCKMSDHPRPVDIGKPYPTHFRCHHLILEFSGFARRKRRKSD